MTTVPRVEMKPMPDEPKVIIVKEPCKCGMTDFAREVTIFTRFGICVLAIIVLPTISGCWITNHFDLERFRILADRYEFSRKRIGDDFEIKPKEEKKP